ncbi:MAG: M20/M25/M40 family metallo-hydrolase [Anaerolineaceae bacterium]|nr:M20/M25/M40 family metallo-hydrolase [Anaerolineaceae bacterium]
MMQKPAPPELANWLSQLIKIPSVNTAQAGGDDTIAGEKRLATALSNWFRQFGGDVTLDEVLPDRPNVYAIWRGASDLWRAVDVHMDTVGIRQMTEPPFSGDIIDGKVRGRGAADTKATLGVLLAILEKLHQNKIKLDFNLLISATADEEIAQAGAQGLARWLPKKGIKLNELLVAEPTLCQPAVGHKGDLCLIFDIHGKAAHSSQPEQGENAITAAAKLITALEAEHQRLQTLPPLPPLGHGKLTVTIVEGGSGTNVVPASCKVAADRRVLPGEDFDQIGEHLQRLAEEHCPLPFTMKSMDPLKPFWQAADTPWVQSLVSFTGCQPITVPYGTNASYYPGLAQEIVVLGPGSIDQAHGAQEWIAVSELERMRDILLHWWGL